ncbi:DUF1501 domain-containing protein [Marinicella litoralis]|uniref:Uncharacterized protein (DUF1501 family) n=1 Tax=Marinicella litoralis TaxID=644220 RepID=A0A4R6XTB4_9GAMM|nr:DUF1501 domain-containing protein [Marinicella litoralis]TDR20673.1 uncharacterized protein (DUF1501 family) [Marinicella litoralis]
MKRREFLKISGLAAVPLISPRLVFAQQQGSSASDVLVCVYQRGAADGLNLVVPHGDADYYLKRPNIGIAKPNQSNGAIDLDGYFGLNPNMASLKPIYDAGDLAVVHAVGSPDPSRSHFEAQDYMEFGTPGINTTADGWLNRYLSTLASPASTFQGVGFGHVQLALQGQQPVVGMNSIDGYDLNTHADDEDPLRTAITELFNQSAEIDDASHNILASVDELKMADPGSIEVENNAVYPPSPFGNDMKQVAQLIKSGIGLQVACVDVGGWDHHDQLVAAMSPLAADFADTLAAFYTDLGANMSGVTVVTMTEFGRRVAENASLGTDHGHGSVMFAMGAGTHGGQVITDWPGLAEQNLFQGDLAITTDYRTVLADALINRLSAQDISTVFPGFQGPLSAGVFSAL